MFYLTFTPWLKALLTGIALFFAMADHYQLIFPMIITCLGATISAQRPGGKPLYLSLLAWALVKQQPKDDGNVAAQSATLLEGNRADT